MIFDVHAWLQRGAKKGQNEKNKTTPLRCSEDTVGVEPNMKQKNISTFLRVNESWWIFCWWFPSITVSFLNQSAVRIDASSILFGFLFSQSEDVL